MKVQARVLVVTLAAAAGLLTAGPMLPEAMAQTTSSTARTGAIADTWWYHGYVEVGARFFLNNPQKDGRASENGKSLAKFYEYQDLRPGPFGDFNLSTGTNSGLYQIDVWGKNVGYDDQRFDVNASTAGQHYFNFQWDETQHVISKGALTLYNGLGTNTLTLPAGLAAQLNTACGDSAAANCAAPGTAKSLIDQNVHQTDLGIRRDTATVDYRWTPNANWDIAVNYSNMHRTGSQVDGLAFGPNQTNQAIAQVPKPVNDTTQNYGLNGEYAGTSPWGKNFTFKVGYSGSTYTDKWDSYTVQDPFCPSGGITAGLCGAVSGTGSNAYSPTALVSLWPSNQANGFNATLGADLPAKSRYMGTLAYTMMRQDAAFLPFTITPTPWMGAPAQPTPTLPASSLNGAINTFLTNNVVTTQITPELKSKLSYRYYDFNNDTPELLFNNWIVTDSGSAGTRAVRYFKVRSLSVAYNKQNAGADLDWSPNRQWNTGIGYTYERYSWNRADADATNENGGKAFVDWKPATWITTRASWLYSERRYNNYNYLDYVGHIQWNDPTCQVNPPATPCGSQYSTAMRQFYLSNRDRNKGQVSVAVDVIRGLTVTPTFGYQDDSYQLAATEVGLTRNQAIRSGAELAYVVNPGTTFLFAYMNEQSLQNQRSINSAALPLTTAGVFNVPVRDTVNTFIGTVNYAAIPNKLDLKASYTLSLSKVSQPLTFDSGATPAMQYPDVKGQWQRFELSGKYAFDQETVRRLGLKGEMYAKLRYAWESNSVDNYGNDIMQASMALYNVQYGRMTWMAFDNPNYNVHQFGASLGLKW